MTDAQKLVLKQGELDAVYEMCTRITEERDALRAAGDEMARLIRWAVMVTDCREACLHPACLLLRSGVAWRALAGRGEGA